MIVSAKYMICLALLAVVLGAAAILGLREGILSKGVASDEPIPAQVEATVWPAKLTMTLDKTTFKVGEPVNINLTLTNISNKTIFLSRSCPPVLDFAVYNMSLQPIYASSWGGSIQVVLSYPIEPGGSFNYFNHTLMWAQLGKYGSALQYVYRQVEPGTYFILGRTAPGGHVLYEEEGSIKQVSIETEKIQIEIIS